MTTIDANAFNIHLTNELCQVFQTEFGHVHVSEVNFFVGIYRFQSLSR